MFYKLGRVLQGIGLFVTLPLALAGSMMQEIDEKTFWILSAMGVGVFVTGYVLQQAGKPQ